MNHKEIFHRFNEASVRIDSMIYLAGEAMDSRGTDAVRDFLDYSDDKAVKAIFGDALPDWLFEDAEYANPEHFIEAIFEAGKLGFLIQFASPVRHYGKDGRSWRSSWGHYGTAWFYGETVEEAIEQGHAWAERQAEHDRQQSMPKSA